MSHKRLLVGLTLGLNFFDLNLAFSQPPNGMPKRNAQLEKKGQTSYSIHCSSCHGEKLDGKGPIGDSLIPRPRNLITATWPAGDSSEQLFKWTSEGIPGTMMMGFKHLPEAERWNLVFYIQSRRGKK